MADSSIDIRRLNYLRLCLLKDDEESKLIPTSYFLKTASKILSYNGLTTLEESDIYKMIKE